MNITNLNLLVFQFLFSLFISATVRRVSDVPDFIRSATVAAVGHKDRGEESAGALLRRLEEFEILDDLEDRVKGNGQVRLKLFTWRID